MDTNNHDVQFSLDIIWTALHAYGETCLGNQLGQDADSMEYATEWAEVCEAMSTIEDNLPQGYPNMERSYENI